MSHFHKAKFHNKGSKNFFYRKTLSKKFTFNVPKDYLKSIGDASTVF